MGMSGSFNSRCKDTAPELKPEEGWADEALLDMGVTMLDVVSL